MTMPIVKEADRQDKKREAEDFLRDTNELTRKKSLLWQHHMNTLQNNLDITSKAIVSGIWPKRLC